MIATYLAIENDLAVHERESKFWLARNVSSVRASSLYEGIALAMRKQFYYIGINASNINYLPMLPYLREVTNDPIFIASDSYTPAEHAKALEMGADLFAPLSDNPIENFNSVVAAVNRINHRAKQKKPIPGLLIFGNMLVSHAHRHVLIDNKIIKMTKTDFDLLYYFLENHGRVFTHAQLYTQVWGDENDADVIPAVKSAITRLRKKLSGNNASVDFIENVWGMGYRFPLKV